MQPYTSGEALVHRACEQAIRLRLAALEEAAGGDDEGRLVAKRRSLDLLHLAFQEDRLDGLQIKLLDQLLVAYRRRLDERSLPIWPGAEAKWLQDEAEVRFSIDLARSELCSMPE